jgi:hypothetical protein
MALPAYKDDELAQIGQTAHAAIDDAKVLADIALQMQDAESGEALSVPLKRNLELWAAIRYDVAKHTVLPEGIRGGLMQLADYVTATTLRAEHAPLSIEQIRALITINLRIAAGLIEGQIRALMGEDTYRLWEEQGRPQGPDFEAWLSGSPAGDAVSAG